ncbi:MAG TPA: gephyrin-like molybdotransferase Glp [Xanthobacteraceae bacterium]|nr:gephyrin-like molybdotransferase Glp [Xanthobacteraceae bacterium]
MALLSVADALALVLADAAPLPAEPAALVEACGRVLADDLAALRTQPPADVSAMDGYAVRAADVATVPARLALVGEVAAGRPFDREVGPGEAARIFTGGVVPAGADTVVIQEVTTRDGDAVLIWRPEAKGHNVRPEGLDFKAGATLLAKGRRLTARDIALAGAMNHAAVPVHRRPRMAVLATGDELVAPGTPPAPGEIVSSNGLTLMAIANHEGADTLDLGIAPDRLDATIAAVRRAREAGVDVLVTTGGASVGDYDFIQRAFAAEGIALSFWKVAVRPGRPLMHGRLGNMQVLGLPGNPVSFFVCAALFLVPLLRRLAGRADLSLAVEHAVLGCALPANDERADYMRATLVAKPDGTRVATPFPRQDSSMLAPLARADCLVIREPFAPAAEPRAPCAIISLQF